MRFARSSALLLTILLVLAARASFVQTVHTSRTPASVKNSAVAVSLQNSPHGKRPSSLGLRRAFSAAIMSESSRLLPRLTTDANSTDTANWACIRFHESRGIYSEPGGGAYQFQNSLFRSITGLTGSPGAYPRAVQDRAALLAYAYWQRVDGIGFHPWVADRYVCHLPW